MQQIMPPLSDTIPTGRLAPSPTGLLHLGNAWSFLLAWLGARSQCGRVVLRIEDLDPERSRQEWTDGIIRDLRWLGLDWDEGPDTGGANGPYLQSQRSTWYERMLNSLKERNLVYPCFCTRKELRDLAGAPHGAADGLGDCGAAYPGTCRSYTKQQVAALRQSGRRESHRLLCPDGEKGRIDFNDLVWGPQSSTLTSCGGDFVIRRSDGVWAYQLAVVCDDIAMGINQVTRGCDILASTPRQLLLYRLFRKKAPQYAHVPLLCDGGGERLAKRHKSLSLDALRRAGCTPESIVGWLACKAGLQETSSAARPQQLAETLRVNGGLPWHRLRQERITVTDALQQEWLS